MVPIELFDRPLQGVGPSGARCSPGPDDIDRRCLAEHGFSDPLAKSHDLEVLLGPTPGTQLRLMGPVAGSRFRQHPHAAVIEQRSEQVVIIGVGAMLEEPADRTQRRRPVRHRRGERRAEHGQNEACGLDTDDRLAAVVLELDAGGIHVDELASDRRERWLGEQGSEMKVQAVLERQVVVVEARDDRGSNVGQGNVPGLWGVQVDGRPEQPEPSVARHDRLDDLGGAVVRAGVHDEHLHPNVARREHRVPDAGKGCCNMECTVVGRDDHGHVGAVGIGADVGGRHATTVLWATMPMTSDPNPADTARIDLEPAVAVERSASGMLLFNARTGSFVELDDIGAEFWSALEVCATTSEAIERLGRVFDVDRATIEADLAVFVDQLAASGLLAVDEPVGESDGDAVERRLDRSVKRYLDLVEAAVTARTTPLIELGRHVEGTYRPGDLDSTEVTAMLTLVGAQRIRNVRDLAERTIADAVPGDFVECGVWRGGSSIVMRAVLAAHEVHDRRVWLADSFRGLPPVDVGRFPLDAMWSGLEGTTAATVEEVSEHFRRFGLLDDQVRFVEGWFRDSLPAAPIEQIALLRLDGDLYESTIDALTHLYDRVSPGGFVIVDEYVLESCRAAVDDFRADRRIDADLVQIDWSGAWWRVPPC